MVRRIAGPSWRQSCIGVRSGWSAHAHGATWELLRCRAPPGVGGPTPRPVHVCTDKNVRTACKRGEGPTRAACWRSNGRPRRVAAATADLIWVVQLPANSARQRTTRKSMQGWSPAGARVAAWQDRRPRRTPPPHRAPPQHTACRVDDRWWQSTACQRSRVDPRRHLQGWRGGSACAESSRGALSRPARLYTAHYLLLILGGAKPRRRSRPTPSHPPFSTIPLPLGRGTEPGVIAPRRHLGKRGTARAPSTRAPPTPSHAGRAHVFPRPTSV